MRAKTQEDVLNYRGYEILRTHDNLTTIYEIVDLGNVYSNIEDAMSDIDEWEE